MLTSVAILCFSANSILCRLALAPDLIDPATFTSVRVASAVAMLVTAVLLRHRRLPRFAYANLRISAPKVKRADTLRVGDHPPWRPGADGK